MTPRGSGSRRPRRQPGIGRRLLEREAEEPSHASVARPPPDLGAEAGFATRERLPLHARRRRRPASGGPPSARRGSSASAETCASGPDGMPALVGRARCDEARGPRPARAGGSGRRPAQVGEAPAAGAPVTSCEAAARRRARARPADTPTPADPRRLPSSRETTAVPSDRTADGSSARPLRRGDREPRPPVSAQPRAVVRRTAPARRPARPRPGRCRRRRCRSPSAPSRPPARPRPAPPRRRPRPPRARPPPPAARRRSRRRPGRRRSGAHHR